MILSHAICFSVRGRQLEVKFLRPIIATEIIGHKTTCALGTRTQKCNFSFLTYLLGNPGVLLLLSWPRPWNCDGLSEVGLGGLEGWSWPTCFPALIGSVCNFHGCKLLKTWHRVAGQCCGWSFETRSSSCEVQGHSLGTQSSTIFWHNNGQICPLKAQHIFSQHCKLNVDHFRGNGLQDTLLALSWVVECMRWLIQEGKVVYGIYMHSEEACPRVAYPGPPQGVLLRCCFVLMIPSGVPLTHSFTHSFIWKNNRTQKQNNTGHRKKHIHRSRENSSTCWLKCSP